MINTRHKKTLETEALKYYRVFLLVGSIAYLSWGPLSEYVMEFHNEKWWWRPLGASVWIFAYFGSLISEKVKKNISTLTFLGSIPFLSSFIWFVAGEANHWANNQEIVLGIFLMVFLSGIFLTKHWQLVVLNMTTTLTIFASYKMFALEPDLSSQIFKHTIVSTQTFLLLIHVVLLGKIKLIERIEKSTKNIQNIIDAGIGPVLIAENNIIWFVNKAFKETFKINPIGKSIEELLVKESDEDKYYKVDSKQVSFTKEKLFLSDNSQHEIFSITDMTQEIKTNIKKLELSKLASLGELAAGIAHEINNPLMTIKLLIYDLKETDDRRKENLTQIDDTINKIADIVSSLREYAVNTKERPSKEVAFQSILKKVIGLSSLKIDSENINLKVNAPKEDVLINVQETKVGQVLINLINNSCHSIKDLTNKNISINLETKGNFAVLRIEDSGNGIPKNIAERIFDPFFTTKKQGEGTGLGLSESVGIIKGYNGSLSLVKNKPAIFEIKLPLSNKGEETLS